ncbi:MAG: M20/M25/M40 family metallo-hydrolase [Capsulimonadales bacterium]|nr:M20/M25/M40 family metallo-hydrolase [Capsulimonadales bacterium]
MRAPYRFVSSVSFMLVWLSVWLFVSTGVLVRADDRPPKTDPGVADAVRHVRRDRLEKTVRALAAFPTRHTLSGASGADAAADWLYRELKAVSEANGHRLQVEKDTWTEPAGTRVPEPAVLTNVLAILPGESRPNDVIVVSGHYDSRVTDVMNATAPAPGANDDASGVAVTLELARLMAGRRYPCTIVFAAVTGEEQGLLGANHLAERMVGERKNVVAMFTNDIVGNSRGENGKKESHRLRLFSAGYDPAETTAQTARRRATGTDADTRSRTLARAAADSVRRYLRGFSLTLIFRNDRYGRGGDHTPFLNRGFAACRFTEPNEDWRHQHQDLRTENGIVYGDLPEFVDYGYLAQVARANLAVIADLATAPPVPKRVTLRGDLSPDTTLSWESPVESAFIEILWRKTTAPDWEGSRLCPATVGQAVLPLAKDDYLFAVRAVGRTGARSLPAIPVSGRKPA